MPIVRTLSLGHRMMTTWAFSFAVLTSESGQSSQPKIPRQDSCFPNSGNRPCRIQLPISGGTTTIANTDGTKATKWLPVKSNTANNWFTMSATASSIANAMNLVSPSA